MIVLVLIVLAAIGLGVGVVTDNQILVVGALGLSVLAALLILLTRVAPALRARPDLEASAPEEAPEVETPGVESGDEPENVAGAEDRVVFVVGRTTFHRSDCSQVDGKVVSAADRSELEVGGMSACRRCLTG